MDYCSESKNLSYEKSLGNDSKGYQNVLVKFSEVLFKGRGYKHRHNHLHVDERLRGVLNQETGYSYYRNSS